MVLRWISGLLLLSQACMLFGQNGYLPLSREVERAMAKRIDLPRSELHGTIRPYRMREVFPLLQGDTLPPSSLPVLDRWAGWQNGRKFRWGPLADLTAGYDPALDQGIFHQAGAGLWTDLDVGKNLNFHADGQAWYQRFPLYQQEFVEATQVTPGQGYAFGTTPGYTHYDWNAHVSWDPGKFFNITAGRGRNFFGHGLRSLMLSSEAQGNPYLRITTTVWKVKYVSLFNAMNDVRGAEGDPANFRRKYSAIHYLSWNALPRLNLSIFESIIFDPGNDEYPRGFDVHYLNPVIFYRPVEYHVGSPDNALLGMSLNVKVGRHTMLYSQFVLDEFLWVHVRNGTGWFGNKQALQLGAVARDAFRRPGLTLRGEWNYVRPFMYTHTNSLQNYAHFGQPLAHPYGSNVHEVLAQGDLEQGRMLYGIRLSLAWMGTDSVDSYGNNIFRPERERPNAGTQAQQDRGFYHGDHWPQTMHHAEAKVGHLLDRNTGTRLEASYLLRYRTLLGGTWMDHVFRIGIVSYLYDRPREQVVRYHLH